MNYSSRAGEKLSFALEKFGLKVNDLIVADFGASTGGFTDCLLQRGVKKVYAVDTAYGELAWNLRKNPKVIVLERTNAIYLKLEEKMDLITIDLSWTRQKFILPNALSNLKKNGLILALIKPHYEAEKDQLVKGKLKPELVDRVLKQVEKEINEGGGRVLKKVKSPLLGKKGGNEEYFFLIAKKVTI